MSKTHFKIPKYLTCMASILVLFRYRKKFILICCTSLFWMAIAGERGWEWDEVGGGLDDKAVHLKHWCNQIPSQSEFHILLKHWLHFGDNNIHTKSWPDMNEIFCSLDREPRWSFSKFGCVLKKALGGVR